MITKNSAVAQSNGSTLLKFLQTTQHKVPFRNTCEAQTENQKRTANVQMSRTTGVLSNWMLCHKRGNRRQKQLTWITVYQLGSGVRQTQTADLQTCRLADMQTCRLADLKTCGPSYRLADFNHVRQQVIEVSKPRQAQKLGSSLPFSRHGRNGQ